MAVLYVLYKDEGTYIEPYTLFTDTLKGIFKKADALSVGTVLPVRYKLISLLQYLKAYAEIVVAAGSVIVVSDQLLVNALEAT